MGKGFGNWLATGATFVALSVGSVGAQAQIFTGAPTPITPPNAVLESDVSNALANDPELSRDNIEVVAKDGVVDLIGSVSNEIEHDRAVKDARGVAGVARVKDSITIMPRDY